MTAMLAECVHICRNVEPVPPVAAYMAHMDELLDLRVSHLPALARAGDWRLWPMDVTQDSDDWAYHADRGYPIPEGVYTGLFCGDIASETVWMSDVPPEVWSMWDGIEAMRDPSVKRVLISGLGLGVMVKHALRQPHITRVDVVELNADVLALTRPYYRDQRLTVHRGDALTMTLGKRATWDLAYHDIHKDKSLGNLPDYVTLGRHWQARVGRQIFWPEAELAGVAARGSAKEQELWRLYRACREREGW